MESQMKWEGSGTWQQESQKAFLQLLKLLFLVSLQPSGASSGLCVAGRIESGFAMNNDRVVIMPAS